MSALHRETCPVCDGHDPNCWDCGGHGTVATIPTAEQIADAAIARPPRHRRHRHGHGVRCANCGLRVRRVVRPCPRCGEDAVVGTPDEARAYYEARRRDETRT